MRELLDSGGKTLQPEVAQLQVPHPTGPLVGVVQNAFQALNSGFRLMESRYRKLRSERSGQIREPIGHGVANGPEAFFLTCPPPPPRLRAPVHPNKNQSDLRVQ